jgi:hypothetical protein
MESSVSEKARNSDAVIEESPVAWTPVNRIGSQQDF